MMGFASARVALQTPVGKAKGISNGDHAQATMRTSEKCAISS